MDIHTSSYTATFQHVLTSHHVDSLCCWLNQQIQHFLSHTNNIVFIQFCHFHLPPVVLQTCSPHSFKRPHILSTSSLVASFAAFCYRLTSCLAVRNTFCGTCYLPHSGVHKSMAELCSNFGNSAITKCQIAYFSLRISTTSQKSDVTLVFPNTDFLQDSGILAIRP